MAEGVHEDNEPYDEINVVPMLGFGLRAIAGYVYYLNNSNSTRYSS